MAALLPLLRHAGRAEHPVPDTELLDRFDHGRDEGAFTELVRRHGPVVYRICRRLVGPDAADDAFQATFLVLATRLGAARTAGALGSWLAGVAGRVARQMRRGTGRRTRHETTVAETRPTEWADQSIELADQFRVLDEELARLPDALRAPVVLCLLQGRTQEQAAAELGGDARTLRRRLERAKAVLRARLERRGVVPAVAGALVAGVGEASASVPSNLGAHTVALVFDFLTGGTATAGSPPVVLAKGIAMTTITRKFMCAVVTATIGLVSLGVVMADNGPAVAPAPMQSAATPALAPAPPRTPDAVRPITVTNEALTPDWVRDETRTKALVEGLQRARKDDERAVLVQATCVRVPAGFCEQSGLTDESAWVLTPRETRMFTALLRAERDREVLSQPQILVQDGQAGSAQVGQRIEVVTKLEAATKDGNKVYTVKMSPVDLGFKLRVEPRVGANGFVLMRIETENTELAGKTIPVPVQPAGGAGTKSEFLPLGLAATNTQSTQAAVMLPESGTAVIRVPLSPKVAPSVVVSDYPFPLKTAPSDKPTHELLWVLTSYIIRAPEKAKGPQPAQPAMPTPVAPPSASK